jgi:tetratricopeptide (TPR) repeat protein
MSRPSPRAVMSIPCLRAIAIAISVVGLSTLGGCDDLDGRGSNRKGNRLFRETRFIDAAALYENALAKVKDDKIEYNLGLAYSRIFRAGSDELVLLAEKGDPICAAIPKVQATTRSVCVKNDPAEEDRAYPRCGDMTPDLCNKAYDNGAKLRTKKLEELEKERVELEQTLADAPVFERMWAMFGLVEKELKSYLADKKTKHETVQKQIAELKAGGDAAGWLASQKSALASCPQGPKAAVDCMTAMQDWDQARWTECTKAEDCPASATCKQKLELCAIDNKTLADLSSDHLKIWISKQAPDDEIRKSVKQQNAELEKLEAERDKYEAEAEAAKDPATGKFKDKEAYEDAMQKKTALVDEIKIAKEEVAETSLKFTMRSLMTNLWIDSAQFEKAIAYWTGELTSRPNDFEAMSNLAGINLKSGNWRKAIEWYLTVAEKVPEEQNKVIAFSSVGNVAWSKLNSKTLPPDEAVELADLGLGALQNASALAPKNKGFLRLQMALFNFRAVTHGASLAAFIDRASTQDLKGLWDVVSGKPAVAAPPPEPTTPTPTPTPEAPPAPIQAVVDAEMFVAFFNKFGDAIIQHTDACPKMATSLNSTIDANKDLLVKATEARKAKTSLVEEAKKTLLAKAKAETDEAKKALHEDAKTTLEDLEEKMMGRVKDLVPALRKCGSDKDVEKAISRIDSAQTGG